MPEENQRQIFYNNENRSAGATPSLSKTNNVRQTKISSRREYGPSRCEESHTAKIARGEGASPRTEFCWLHALRRGFNFSRQKRSSGDSIAASFKHGTPFAVTYNVSYVSSQRAEREISRWRTCTKCGWILQRGVPRNFSNARARTLTKASFSMFLVYVSRMWGILGVGAWRYDPTGMFPYREQIRGEIRLLGPFSVPLGILSVSSIRGETVLPRRRDIVY